MEAIWQAAISLTGIAGVGAFVLYALYKDWMKLPAVSTLSRQQRFSLFKLFLVLTFLFAAATLALSAYRSHLEKQAAQASATELRNLLDDRYKQGLRLIAEFKESSTPEGKTKLEAFEASYAAQIKATRAALAEGEMVRYHELSKQLLLTVESAEHLSLPQKTRFAAEACAQG